MAHHSSGSDPHLPHFLSIIKVDRSNYSYWRDQALASITAHVFSDFIHSVVVAPLQFLHTTSPTVGNPTLNPAHSLWFRRDQFLLSWLLSSIGESMLGHVVRATQAKDLCHILERLFLSQSKACTMQLRSLLHTTKKGAQPAEEYFLKMQGYADQLCAMRLL